MKVLAMMKCLQKLRMYLLGIQFKVLTDCKAFQTTMTVEIICKQDYFIPKLSSCFEKVLVICVACILSAKTSGKAEGFLNPIDNSNVPLHTIIYVTSHLLISCIVIFL